MSTSKSLRKAIERALETYGPMSVDDIVRGFGCPVTVARNQISTLQLHGKIRHAGWKWRNGGESLYEIARPRPIDPPQSSRQTPPTAADAGAHLFDVWHGRA
jgi:hypothetical protein